MARDLVEAEAHLEMAVLDFKVPIFVLQHDGHLVGGKRSTRWPGIETPLACVLKVM